MLDSVLELIQSRQMLPRGTKVLCAVSGGADSISMLHRLYHLRSQLDIQLVVGHYNHRLRGEDSDRDEEFVRQFVSLCCGKERQMGNGLTLPEVPVFVGSGDVGEEAKRRKAGIEETARDMRYAFLRQIAKEQGCQVIATAHTADDNGETLLLHLMRGTGLRGLCGILPVRGEIIRPLLTSTRSEVEAYLRFHGLPWMVDHTNEDETYHRNYIRRQVMPLLEEAAPGVSRRMTETAALLGEDEDFLTALAQKIADQAVGEEKGSLRLEAKAIGDQGNPVAARAVRILIGRMTSGNDNCSAAHLRAVLSLCRGNDPSGKTNLPNGLIARREYEALVLERDGVLSPLAETPLSMDGEISAGDWRITCSPVKYGGQPQTGTSFYLDREGMTALTVRSRRQGDTLAPPGRPTKSLKKWFVDEKIPAHIRDTIPVLETDGGAVAGVAGLGPEETLVAQTGKPAWHIQFKNR